MTIELMSVDSIAGGGYFIPAINSNVLESQVFRHRGPGPYFDLLEFFNI